MAPEAKIVFAPQEAAEFELPIAKNRIEAVKFGHQVLESSRGHWTEKNLLWLHNVWKSTYMQAQEGLSLHICYSADR